MHRTSKVATVRGMEGGGGEVVRKKRVQRKRH